MLQADAAHVIGEREQNVVMIVVMRAVKFVGLLYQGAVRFQLLGLHLQQIGAVGDDVQVNGRDAARVQIQAREIPAREDRRIHQGVQRYGLEGGEAASR